MATYDAGLWTEDFYRAVQPEVFATGLHRAEPHWVSPAKDQVQTDYDVWYVASGGGGVCVNGTWHAFRAGDLITIKPGDVYEQERTDPAAPFHIYYTHILPFGLDKPSLDRALSRVWPLKISMLHRPEFAGLFHRLFEAYTTRRSQHSLAVRGLVMQILETIFDELRGAPLESPPRAYPNLLRAKELLDREYARDLRLADIARHSDLSISHLSALFTRHFGCPPMEYLLRVRLREAKLLLARAERVKETAHATGFQSQHYFSRTFRQRTGLSPTQFAAMHIRRPTSAV